MPIKTIGVFNNKGGVGKTTYMYNIAHILERKNKTVLIVDLDSQCNLSAYALNDSELERSWNEKKGNSIWRAIEQVYKGIGDIRKRSPKIFNSDYPNLYLVPGDIYLSNYEDILGDSWSAAKGGSEPSLRIQSAIYRYIQWAADKINANVVLVDLGPNLGALNRCVLGACDYFIIPMSPDLFSIRGTENLGNKLLLWGKEWAQCHEAWKGDDLPLPAGRPVFLGYVMQQHNVRSNPQGMTKGWSIFGDRVATAVKENIVDKLSPQEQVHDWGTKYGSDSWNIGKIPNLHSLIPYSQEARKPVFDCTSKDGLKGAHITKAKSSKSLFNPIVERLLDVL